MNDKDNTASGDLQVPICGILFKQPGVVLHAKEVWCILKKRELMRAINEGSKQHSCQNTGIGIKGLLKNSIAN